MKFEGNYLKGKKTGKGKEYDKDGILMYDGEFLNEKRYGEGKEYNIYGNIEFKGIIFKWKKMEWNGKRIYYG